MNILTETRHGPMYTMEHDNIIGRCLREYGEWAQAELDCLAAVVGPGDHVVDIGANIGTHTVFLAKRVGSTGHVLSFEPQHRVYQLLCANVVANDLTNVHAKNWAIGAKVGHTRVPNTSYDVDNNVGASKTGDNLPDNESSIIECVALDALQLPRCDLIKADIEGHELDMLRGAEQTIAKHRPVLYLEYHEPGRAELLALVKSYGYRVFFDGARAFNPDNFKHGADFLGGYVEQNILCVPRDKPINTNLEEL